VASGFVAPDILVLASGGALGEAWMSGLLAGVEDTTGHDFRETESFVGTAAGSLVAAALAAGQRPRHPDPSAPQRALPAGRPGPVGPAGPAGDDVTAQSAGKLGLPRLPTPGPIARSVARQALRLAGAAATPLAPAALAIGSNGSSALRAALLHRAPGKDASLGAIHERIKATGARFDGRLRVVAVDRERGRRVVFGAPGAPDATVAQAVQASCSVPWIFAPVRIGERDYVDGGVWSNTNIDVAPAGRATEVLCLNPIASLDIALASPFGVLRALAGSTAALETLALRNRGARVRMIGPDREAAAIMGPNLMDTSLRDQARAAGYAHGVAMTSR
jgi:NTE family protein